MDVKAPHPLVARDGVRHDGRVDVADVRQVVDVVDRRRDVERLVVHGFSPAFRRESIAPSGPLPDRGHDASTKVTGDLKIGAKVTIQYRMTTVTGDVKADRTK